MDRVRSELRDGKLGGLLWRYSLPAMLGMVLHAVNAVIDRFFVGQCLGESGLAGISVAFPVFTLLMGLTLWVGQGSATAVSVRLGAGDDAGVRGLCRWGVWLAVVGLPVLGGLLYLGSDGLLWLSGGRGEVLLGARGYLFPLCVGFLGWGYSVWVSGVLRSFGHPRLSLVVVGVCPVVNMVLDYVFLVRMGMGLEGAGLATAIGYGVSAVVGGVIWWRVRGVMGKGETAGGGAVRVILRFGLATFLLQVSGAVFHGMINFQAEAYGGEEALAILGVIFAVAGLIFMPVAGIGQGMQPLIGVCAGSGDGVRERRVLRLAVVWGTGILLVVYGVFMSLPAWFLGWFFEGDSLLAAGVYAGRVSFLLMPVIGFQIIAIHYFQAAGEPGRATWLVVLRQLVFLPILLWVLPWSFGLDGVWLVSPVSDGVMGLVTLGVLFRYLRGK